MTEEQGYQIIDLLKQILKKLPNETAYDLHDIHSEIGSVTSAVNDVKRAIENLDFSN